MDAFLNYIVMHPVVFALIVACIILLFIHFTFKSLLRIVFIFLLVFLVVFGFYHYKNREPSSNSPQSTEMFQAFLDDVKTTGRNIWRDLKEVYQKSKAAPKEVGKMLDSSDKQLDKEFKKE